MTPETTAYAVASPSGDVILATIRPTAAEAKGAAGNALGRGAKWSTLSSAGYHVVRVAVRTIPDDPTE